MATTFTDGTDNPAIFPANSLKRSPYASPETPAGQAIGNAFTNTGRAINQGFLPDTRAVLSQSGQDIRDAAANGQYGTAAAHTIRGALATVPAIANDVVNAPLRSISAMFPGGAGQQAQQFGRTLLTGSPAARPDDANSLPLYTPPTFENTTPAAAAPTAAAPAAPNTPSITNLGGWSADPAARLAQLGRDTTHLQDMSRRSLANGAMGIGTPGTPGMTVMDAGVADARQNFFDQAALRTAAAQSSWSPRGGYRTNEAAIQAAAQPIQNRQRLQELSLKNAGDQSIARMRDATDRRGQDIGAETAAGTQAVTLRGQELSAATARAQGARDQLNKDREFDLNKTKTALDITKEQRTAAAESQKRISDQITSMLPAGPDGKPDLNAHAAAQASVNNAIAQRTQLLQAQVAKGGPNAAGAKAELDALERDPFGALGQDNIRKLAVGNQLTQRIQETATGRFNPFGTAASGSTAPVTSLRPDSGLFGTDYVATHADRTTSTIPARKLRDANGNISPDYNLLMVK